MASVDLTTSARPSGTIASMVMGRIALVGLAVFATAYGSIALTRNAQHLSTFWLANAVLLAILLKFPKRHWAMFLAGGFAGQAAAHLLASDPPSFVVGVSLLNDVEVLGIAAALRHWVKRDLDLSRLSHLGAFVLIAGVLAPMGAASVVASLIASVKQTTPATVWAVWFSVNALGFLVFTPPLLIRRSAALAILLKPDLRLETVSWFAALLAVSVGTFAQNSYPLLFLPMAVLAPMAVRLGPARTVLGVSFVSMAAALATLDGRGPIMLTSADPTVRSFVLQGFVAALVLGNLPLTALLSDLGRLDAKAREANRHLQLAETIARMGHWRFDVAANRLTWSDGVYRMRGLDPATCVPTLENAVAGYHPDDRDEVGRAVERAIRSGTDYDLNCRIILRDGTVRDVLARGTCETGPDGCVRQLFGTIMDVTDLRRAERAAMDSEARYRLLADNSTDMITHMDLTGRRLFVSPGSRDLLGYAPEELVSTSPHDMIHPDDAPGLRTVFAGLVAGRTDRVVNVNRLRHRDGRWIWVEASLKLLRGADGGPSGVVGSMRDISERKLADESLRRSEERYRLLADNASDMITHMDLGGRRLFVSPGARDLVGYEPEELVGTPRAGFVHPDDEAGLKRKLDDLMAGRTDCVTNSNRIRHKDGRWIWIEASVRPLRDAAGQPCGLVSALRDITERHEAELALAASEARYRALAETTSDVITQLDLELRRRYVSPSCRKVLGYEPEEMLDVMPSDHIHPEDAPGVRTLALRLVAGEIEGDRAIATYRNLHKRGHWVWLEALMTLVRDDTAGAPASVICSLRDVTERQRVARHLERAKAEAEAASQAKAEFVANMSHELRTPLTGIIGVHDLLRADPGLTAAQRRLADLAGDAGRSLLAIVNDVLDFSKADAGRLALEHVPFDLDDLVASCCDLARAQIGDKAVTLSVACGPHPLGRLTGDPTRVRQILLNLLTNAVKFTERGGITVDASYHDETGLLRVEVADTGIGVSPDQIGALFERFTQADTSTTRRYGGTGLGLAICKRLTDLMGGGIGAEAGAGGGSVFWFEVPLDRSDDRLTVRAKMSRDVVMVAGRNLLLAEDNAVNAEVVAAMLAGRGYGVSIVSDGAAAVRAACDDEGRIDLILMDLQMPVMDGFGATAAIRAHEVRVGGVRLPIVGLTANALAEDADRCLAAGMDAHVAKPIDWARLFTVLDGLLGPDVQPSSEHDRVASRPTDVLDLVKLESLAALIKRDRLGGMLARFVEDLRVRMSAALNGDEAELSRAVHILVSSAGQLGFCELSGLCAEADLRLRSGAGFDRTDELRSAADRAAAAAASSGFPSGA